MTLKKLSLATLLSVGTMLSMPATAQTVLTGDVRLACEAILCLSSGTRPGECAPSLARYFGISYKKWSDTLRGRINFLNLCPASSMDSNMQQLVNAIGSGAGRCDPGSLNSSLQIWRGGIRISNQMPDYCTTYTTNAYTDLKTINPVYVGTPERGGYWVDPSEYQQALMEYNLRVAAEDAAPQSYEGSY